MKPRGFSRWKTCPGFSGAGASVLLSLLSWNHGIVWSKRGFNYHLIPPPFLLLSLISPALFRQQSQLPFHFSWKAIPQPHPSLSRFYLALFQSFPCSAEPGCCVTPSRARLGHCHRLSRSILHFFWDLLRAPGQRGLLQCCCGVAAPN